MYASPFHILRTPLLAVLGILPLLGCENSTPSEQPTTSECLPGERIDMACGLNGAGLEPFACTDGAWVSDGPCTDADRCTNEDTRSTPCDDSDATADASCVDGQWAETTSCPTVEPCEENATQRVTCGFNQRGVELRVCTDGAWAVDTPCVDPDVCLDDDVITASCAEAHGASFLGEQRTECQRGQWNLTQHCTMYGEQIVAGFEHTCSLTAEKTLYCWGRTAQGQGHFEQGTRPFRRAARAHHWTHADDAVRIIGSSNHTLLRTTSGELFCWGNNGLGQCGHDHNGPTEYLYEAAAIPGVTDAVEAAASYRHSCAVTSTGAVQCWGMNSHRQAGHPTDHITTTNTVEGFGPGAAAQAKFIATGDENTCASTVDNRILCWGNNNRHASGIQPAVMTSSPMPAAGGLVPSGIVSLISGSYHYCTLDTVGDVKCWGANSAGQLGPANNFADVPVVQSTTLFERGDLKPIALAAKNHYTCARYSDGAIACTGAFPLPTGEPAPRDGVLTDVYTATDNAHEAIAMALGDGFMCVVRRNREIVCWGKSLQGQVGVGEAGTFIAPGIVQVSPIETDDALRPSTQNPQNN